MKPKNFPARKRARQLAADCRLEDNNLGITVDEVRDMPGFYTELGAMRRQRSKKHRSG